jgi:hypothetical protein
MPMASREVGRAVSRTLRTEASVGFSVTLALCLLLSSGGRAVSRTLRTEASVEDGGVTKIETGFSGEAMARADKAKTVRALNCMLTSTNKRV